MTDVTWLAFGKVSAPVRNLPLIWSKATEVSDGIVNARRLGESALNPSARIHLGPALAGKGLQVN
ncbi:hypothetical protein [Erythrobacter litoralis]|uniref:hypothetical protein n=1 Tax=Erythrobacter litoralis TaxID=39960 RepID=UPI0012DEA385|nr:hypothetical protein [Erythrobacter litoralis]